MKHDGFSSHLVQRFFERYGKLITSEDINKIKVQSLNAPQLKYTTIKHTEFLGVKVYAFMKTGTIATFLTERQAMNTQKFEQSEKQKPIVKYKNQFRVESSAFDKLSF